jgi:hypothetical protein
MARLTIVSNTETLYLFPESGVAPFMEALPADLAVDSLIDFPIIFLGAPSDLTGIGAAASTQN